MAWIQNKRVVITGATSGIGKELATRLASRGAQVVLACRDASRGERVADDINAAMEGERASVMTVDTSDQSSIRAFTSDYCDTYQSLDVLVNNAGVLMPERHVSVDGIELTFATNVIGYYLVTIGLLDALTAGAPARVVNVASTFAGDLDLDDLQFQARRYDGMKAYAQSKACDRMLTWALARRLEAERVTANALAPGLVLETSLYRHLTPAAKQNLARFGGHSLSEGTETALRLASDADLTGVTGQFFENRVEVPCEFRDEGSEERLWQACVELAAQLEPRH